MQIEIDLGLIELRRIGETEFEIRCAPGRLQLRESTSSSDLMLAAANTDTPPFPPE